MGGEVLRNGIDDEVRPEIETDEQTACSAKCSCLYPGQDRWRTGSYNTKRSPQ